MDLIAELAKHKRTIDEVQKIYSGLCNCCRCGCGGKYFEKGSIGFKRALTRIQKSDFVPLPEGVEVWAPAHHDMVKSEGVVYDNCYIDIPYDADRDKCYCLYFVS